MEGSNMEAHLDFEGNYRNPKDVCLYSSDTDQILFTSTPGVYLNEDQRRQLHAIMEVQKRNGSKILRKNGKEQNLIDNLLQEFKSATKIDIHNTDTLHYFIFGRNGGGGWLDKKTPLPNHPVQSCKMSYLTALILRRLFRHNAEPDAKDQAEIWNALIGALFRFYVKIGEIDATTGELIVVASL